jgi:hypothetical protein
VAVLFGWWLCFGGASLRWWYLFGGSSFLLMHSHGRRPWFVDFIAVGWKCCYSSIVDWACFLLLNREPGGCYIVQLFRDQGFFFFFWVVILFW